jgi:hypothetical protein
VKWNIFPKSKVNRPDESPTMKHNHNHDNARSAGPQLVPVRFEFTHPTATTVCIAGTFNHWQPGGGRPMDARSARQRNRAQPVWREKLGSEGGQLAGSSPSRRRGKFTTEKRKQMETTESDGKQVAIKKPRMKNPAAH